MAFILGVRNYLWLGEVSLTNLSLAFHGIGLLAFGGTPLELTFAIRVYI